ncbi:MAG: alpha-1,2-fucosyltransferase [Lachnospiraceae bacterium]|nr:alpha-1,2-fucosyltransferase [Lachnospiraceae bacterium]
MKIVKAFGGLGNQMFQYAFYLYLKENNPDTYFDIKDYDIHEYHCGFELTNIFGVQTDDVPQDAIKKISIQQESIIVRLLRKYFGARLCKTDEIFENKEYTFVPFRCFQSDTVLRGNWQDINYLIPIEKKIRSVFTFHELNDKKNAETAKKIMDSNSVSIHIRRGDYLQTSNLGGVIGEDYYKKAIDYIEKRVQNPVYIVFSDEIEWCRHTLKNLKAVFVDWNTGTDSYKDMQLMSLCKHNIIANSSFSWWGAWLNPNENKIVIMPEVWDAECAYNKLVWDRWQTM